MADHLKSEEDQARAARRAYLYSIPVYNPANEAMPANSAERRRGPDTEGDSNRERPRPGDITGIPARGPQRLKLNGPRPPIRRGPKRLWLNGPRPPIRNGPKRIKLNGPRPPIRKVNTRLAIPRTDKKTYRRGNKSYICPKGIEPWTAEHRWMLDPGSGIFKQDGTFHYVP